MSSTFFWTPDPTQTITSFTLTKSVNQGLSYSALATIPWDVAGANYNKQRKQFFYVDAGGAEGDIYQIVANGAFGVSEPLIIVAPPAEPDLCTIVGYCRDPFGFVDRDVAIHVTAVGTPGERWASSPAGIVGQHHDALGIVSRKQVVYPDENGMWQVSLVRRIYAKVEIPALDFSWAFEVPQAAGPVNIRDIPQLRGAALALFPDMQGERLYLPES